jgi:D-3-phosphoglycerate dehydrogenase
MLCMVDLRLAPEALERLQRAFEVTYSPTVEGSVVAGKERGQAAQAVAARHIDAAEIYWGHTDIYLGEDLIARALHLRVVATASTGTDHLDRAALEARGVTILSITKDFALLDTFTATAECAWMLMLACHRNLLAASANVTQAGRWRAEDYLGHQLSGETLGVYGMGRLGKMTAAFGLAFRMRVLACDVVPFEHPGVEAVSFECLLRESDAISIHVHLDQVLPDGSTINNRGRFDSKALSQMKPGCVLVNTSRGDIVDERAILAALEARTLRSYGTDVVMGADGGANKLVSEWAGDMRKAALVRYAQSHANLVITPHIGGGTFKSVIDARVFTARRLVHFMETGDILSAEHEIPFDDWPPQLPAEIVRSYRPAPCL